MALSWAHSPVIWHRRPEVSAAVTTMTWISALVLGCHSDWGGRSTGIATWRQVGVVDVFVVVVCRLASSSMGMVHGRDVAGLRAPTGLVTWRRRGQLTGVVVNAGVVDVGVVDVDARWLGMYVALWGHRNTKKRPTSLVGGERPGGSCRQELGACSDMNRLR